MSAAGVAFGCVLELRGDSVRESRDAGCVLKVLRQLTYHSRVRADTQAAGERRENVSREGFAVVAVRLVFGARFMVERGGYFVGVIGVLGETDQAVSVQIEGASCCVL